MEPREQRPLPDVCAEPRFTLPREDPAWRVRSLASQRALEAELLEKVLSLQDLCKAVLNDTQVIRRSQYCVEELIMKNLGDLAPGHTAEQTNLSKACLRGSVMAECKAEQPNSPKGCLRGSVITEESPRQKKSVLFCRQVSEYSHVAVEAGGSDCHPKCLGATAEKGQPAAREYGLRLDDDTSETEPTYPSEMTERCSRSSGAHVVPLVGQTGCATRESHALGFQLPRLGWNKKWNLVKALHKRTSVLRRSISADASQAPLDEDGCYTSHERAILTGLRHTVCGKWAALMIEALDVAEFGSAFPSQTEPSIKTVCQVHEEWFSTAPALRGRTANQMSGVRGSQGTRDVWMDSDNGVRRSFGDVEQGNGPFQCLVMSPSNSTRFFWTLLSGLFVVVEVVALPLRMVSLADERGLQLFDNLSLFVWIIDFFLQFLMAYSNRHGVVEMRLRYIAQQYLRTWFVLDSSLILFDLSVMFASSGSALDALKYTRLLRFARLLRLRKLQHLLSELATRCRVDFLLLCLRILEHLVYILLVNHYIACAWFGVGTVEGSDWTWVKQHQLMDKSVIDRYILSLHWSLTQFTPATNNVSPESTLERVFAIIVVVWALVSFSSFVSGVTNAVTELRAMSKSRRSEVSELRKYLWRKKISTQLGVQIIHFFEQNHFMRKFSTEADIAAFKDFPESLIISLRIELNRPILLSHPLFVKLKTVDVQLMANFCHMAMRDVCIRPSHDVFLTGDESEQVNVLLSGRAHYKGDSVPEGTWMSEMALWVKWVRQGHLVATSACEFVELSCPTVRKLVMKHGGKFHDILKAYVAFVVDFMDSRHVLLSTDLPIAQDIQEVQASRAVRLCELKAVMSAKKGRK